jgi:hypothetical protein
LQVCGATLREAFGAWLSYIELSRTKRSAAFKGLYFWMNSRLRMAFNTLR